MRDELGELYQDEPLAKLFSGEGRPAIAAWRLAWVAVPQRLPRGFRIGKRPARCGIGLTGSMCWARA